MDIQLDDDSNRNVYADWHGPLLEKLFGDSIDLHGGFYELTHTHRVEHNSGAADGTCTAWPSPPSRAPIWHIIADEIGATRFLEIGTALGYTSALMADAVGPAGRVDTIENDLQHADIAERELDKLGVLDRVRVIRGRAEEVLPKLEEPYDAVFDDGATAGLNEEAVRLTRSGGVPPGFKQELRQPLIKVLVRLRDRLEAGAVEDELAFAEARQAYMDTVLAAIRGRQS